MFSRASTVPAIAINVYVGSDPQVIDVVMLARQSCIV